MVKLSTGKEIELREPTRKQALKLKIASAAGYDGYDVFYDAALIGIGTTAELEKFSDEEIIEIAGLVFENMNLSGVQKKS